MRAKPARNRRFVTLFDVDGPLRTASASLAKFLLGKGLFTEHAYKKCVQDVELSKAKKITYRQITDRISNHWAEGLKGQNPVMVRKVLEEFVQTPELMNAHTYARELVERMNQRGATIAITGQPQELAEAFMKVLPFSMAFGSEFEVKNGRYTGRRKTNMALAKKAVVRELKKHPNIWGKMSYGFGDRTTDKEMLELVRKPIALNPDKKMERLAKRKGWPIVHGKQILRRIRKL